jgi:hypothetical protein
MNDTVSAPVRLEDASAWASLHERLSRLFRDTAFPAWVFVVSRAAVFLFSSQAMRLVPDLVTHQINIRQPILSNFPALDGLCRWDCALYEQTARAGYQTASDPNMWPLYPWISRGLARLTGMHLHMALMVVPQIACLASYVVIYRLFVKLSGKPPARWALLAFAFYPFSFFHAAGYPESLMVLCTALAVSLAIERQHIWAGVFLAAALMARHLGLLAGASLLGLHVLQRGVRPKALLWNVQILGLAIPWMILLTWSVYLQYKVGDALAYVHARNLWGESAWWGVRDLFRMNDTKGMTWFYWSLLPGAGAVGLLTKRRWWGLAPYAIIYMTTMWVIGGAALGRYSASCWPAFLPMGYFLARRPNLQGVAIGALALSQGLWLWLFVHQWWVV